MSLCLKAVIALACVGAVCARAQDAGSRPPEVTQLSQDLQQTRAELAESKRQIEELRQSLEELRKQVQSGHPAEPAPAAASEPTVAAADQDVGFLAAKVGEMHQDKVESATKYPVKLSGLILFNSYWNKGILDIQDLPSLALPNFPGAPSPGIGGTLRQTMLGVDAVGPKLFGAQTSAGAEVDFAGGNPTTASDWLRDWFVCARQRSLLTGRTLRSRLGKTNFSFLRSRQLPMPQFMSQHFHGREIFGSGLRR